MKLRQDKLSKHLLEHDFEYDDDHWLKYLSAKMIAEHYAMAENAVAVLSNMACDKSYICYGRLGRKLGLGSVSEEVESIWEKEILDRIHPDDMAEKIAWELQFLTFVKQLPSDERQDYYLQHFLRFDEGQGNYYTLRHRILYLDYDTEGRVMLTLCLYTAYNEQQGVAGVFNSLSDTRVKADGASVQGLLSDRECEILHFIGQGIPSKQIADTLCISANTVNNHRQNIIRKLHCRNTTEALGVAHKLGLIK